MDNKSLYKAIRDLKDAAKTVYNNADKIIGGYQNQMDSVDIKIRIKGDTVPIITVNQTLCPDHIKELC